jgi:hypothetical protein
MTLSKSLEDAAECLSAIERLEVIARRMIVTARNTGRGDNSGWLVTIIDYSRCWEGCGTTLSEAAHQARVNFKRSYPHYLKDVIEEL